MYTEGKSAAEEMIDKGKNPADLTDKVHRIGRVVGRTELDLQDDSVLE